MHGILPRRFAQRFRIIKRVTQIVGDLKRLTDQGAKVFPRFGVVASGQRTHQGRGDEQRPGLGAVIGGQIDHRLAFPGLPCANPAGRAGALHVINLTASCLWCHEDENPGHYDSGFMLLQAPREYDELVSSLRNYFSFHPLSASA